MKHILIAVILAGMSGLAAGGADAQTTYAEAMEAGREHLRFRQLDEARAAFIRAAELTERGYEQALARVHAGHAHYHAGRYADARAEYAEVLAVPGLSGEPPVLAHQYTGHTYLQEGDYAAALAAYREAMPGARPTLRRNLENDAAFTYREAVMEGVRDFRLGQEDSALARLHYALTLDGIPPREAARAWLTRGQVHARRGETEQSEAAFRQVAGLDGNAFDPWLVSEALLGLGRLRTMADRHEEAGAYGRRLLAMGRHAHPRHRREAEEILRRSGESIPMLPAEYGADANPTGSPVGGGSGYAETFTSGDIEVATTAELLAALTRLDGMEPSHRDGTVVFIQPDAKLNLAGHTGIRIPSGVTLAGNRGVDGADGPLLHTDQPLTGFVLFSLGAGARLTGIRMRGDAPTFAELFAGWPHAYFSPNRFVELGRQRPTVVALSAGENSRIDNCVIGQFARGISVATSGVRIQHNLLHDISPYPIVTSAGSFNPLIEANIIDWAWHGVATSDHMTASFTARYNLVRETSPNLLGQGVSGCFALDHHGQGEYFLIHHNTFVHMDRTESVPGRAIALAPAWDSARIYGNHFVDYMRADEATYWTGQRPVKDMTDLRDIVTRRDLSPYLEDYLRTLEDFSDFDLREIVAMTRAGGGGENLWIYDNAYGEEMQVLERTLLTTPRIFLQHPTHRKVRTGRGAGRGGETFPALMHLRGEVPLVIEVEVKPPLELTEVTVDLITPDLNRLFAGGYTPSADECRRLYEGSAAPDPGAVILDTTPLPNGIYGLIVTAGDQRGIRAHHMTFFETVNP